MSNATVITVENLNDSGAGSLRDAIETAWLDPEVRTIEFNVTGTIFCESPYMPLPENLTINFDSKVLLGFAVAKTFTAGSFIITGDVSNTLIKPGFTDVSTYNCGFAKGVNIVNVAIAKGPSFYKTTPLFDTCTISDSVIDAVRWKDSFTYTIGTNCRLINVTTAYNRSALYTTWSSSEDGYTYAESSSLGKCKGNVFISGDCLMYDSATSETPNEVNVIGGSGILGTKVPDSNKFTVAEDSNVYLAYCGNNIRSVSGEITREGVFTLTVDRQYTSRNRRCGVSVKAVDSDVWIPIGTDVDSPWNLKYFVDQRKDFDCRVWNGSTYKTITVEVPKFSNIIHKLFGDDLAAIAAVALDVPGADTINDL